MKKNLDLNKLTKTAAVFVCLLQFSFAKAQDVLIIYDDSLNNPYTISLQNALITEGFNVTFSAVSETAWDNTNPSLTGIEAVIHLNGDTYDTEMPIAGQVALTNFVNLSNGLYIGFEWNAYEVDDLNQMMSMLDLVLFTRLSSFEGVCSYEVVPAQSAHPVLEDVTVPFNVSSVVNTGPIRTFVTEPSLVLMTYGSSDAVAIRNFGTGHVLGFSHSGNYNNHNPLTSVEVQKIITNFIHEYAFVSSASIGELASIDLSIYPNPAHSQVTLSSSAAIEKVTIYDISGALIQTEKTNTFSIEHLTNGVYMINVYTSKGMGTQQFIKE